MDHFIPFVPGYLFIVFVGFLLLIPAVDLVEKSLGLLLTHVAGYAVGIPLMLLLIYLIRKIETVPGVNFDERDKFIIKKAIISAFTAVSIVLLAWYILTLFFLGDRGFVSVSALPVVVYAASVLFVFVCCIAVLVQYGRGAKTNE